MEGSIVSPKPKAEENWYSYYAGFSEAFAREVLTRLSLSPQSLVLDPWNGSGTTTAVARALGQRSRGYDLNPVMVVVAKARLLDPGVLPSVDSIVKEILAEARSIAKGPQAAHEPLSTWFGLRSASYLRAVERGIQRVLISYDHPLCVADPAIVDKLSTLAAFFYVCLFRAVRGHLAPFFSTNPTWIKDPESASNRVRPSRQLMERRFREEACEMVRRLKARNGALGPDGGPGLFALEPTIQAADSAHLPDPDESVDAVLSSPPYCTRIDYAVATKAELAVLGLSTGKDFSRLRRSLLGTTAIGDEAVAQETPAWGRTCLEFVRLVQQHPSRASRTYYLNGFLRYFRGLYSSLAEVGRVLKPGGTCVIVAQDSFYKGERTHLQRIVTEMSQSLGCELQAQYDFRHRRTKAAVNPRSRKYRAIADATESVLFLRKASAVSSMKKAVRE